MPTIPQSERQYVEEQKRICQAEWFKDHKAQCQATGDIGKLVWETALLIHWQNPKSWNYGCRFIVHRRWLIVVGDIGEAVYEWGQDIALEFLAQIDFGYFLSKCRASEKGSDFSMWSAEVEMFNRLEKLKDLEARKANGEDTECDRKEFEILQDNSGCDENQWRELAQEYYNATGDAEGAGDLSSIGKVPNCRAIGHFVGLQMAIKQLLNRPQP